VSEGRASAGGDQTAGAFTSRTAVGLSTGSVFPDRASVAFTTAAALGYDGVEVLVSTDPDTQSAETLTALADSSGVPVLAVHAPCLLTTATVWSSDPLVKLSRSIDLAERLGARTVVTHPPFVWQRAAAATFTQAVAELQDRTPVRIAVENMFPVRVRGALVSTYRPHWNPVPAGHRWFTLDLSHTATSGSDALAMAAQMGSRLGHLHLADGSGSIRDEHLVPGRGGQPCGPVLEAVSAAGFDGSVVVEVSTRRSGPARDVDLAEALSFARLHLST
jgi:sugar phosphate isomerase/epimerase